MSILIQVFLGWPAVLAFLTLATIGAWKPDSKFMAVSFVLSLPNAFYLFTGNGLIQLVAVAIPLGLAASIVLINKGYTVYPRILLLPIYTIYALLAIAVSYQ